MTDSQTPQNIKEVEEVKEVEATEQPKEISPVQQEISTLVNTQKSDLIDPIAWKQIRGMADTLIKSHALPEYVKNKEQAIVVMQAGYEMGMKPMESLNSLYIVNGQITIWGKALAKRFRLHNYKLSFKDKTNETTVTATNKKTGEVFTETMTFQEAEASGYTKTNSGGLKFGWKEGSNRILKLRYGALNKMLKTQTPEVLESAVGVAEVYQDSDTPKEYEEGQIINDEKVLDPEFITRINQAKTVNDLMGICKAIKTEVNADYHKSVNIEYTRRRQEIEETAKEVK